MTAFFQRLNIKPLLLLPMLLIGLLTGCVDTGAAPTAGIKTVIVPTSTPVPPTAVVTASPSQASPDTNLPQTITGPNGVLTVHYPAGWSAQTLGTSVSLSTKPDLGKQIGQRTFAADELVTLIDYALREDVATALELKPDFTLEELGAVTENDIASTTTESLQVNNQPAIAQTGIIDLDGVSADVYSLTFEVDGVLVTITSYGAPGQLAQFKALTVAIASALTVDTSLVTSLSEQGNVSPVATPEG
ncbi:MAG TPA: hypothetical protein VHL11_25295 [Phototrophicaceae bacterium]|jgi:hypothetical protein|nr:hypothetical protein [Phototrophicaceae bacterium]